MNKKLSYEIRSGSASNGVRTILPADSNPALRGIAREVPISDITGKHIKKLIAEMKALLSKEKYGVALAASQVGEPVRLFIVSGRALARDSRNSPDEPEKKDERPAMPDQVYINPVLLKISRMKKEKHEGCLSIRGKWGVVPRAEKVMLRAHNENGEQFTRGASGFLAHVFQHEMDHLDGILYTDKATNVYDEKPEEPEAHE
ncbi:peptide deformylase [Candidatus Kaiserbacteria bacterium]|nr:peptide deformylase [Candidatus Kaiserbacteria bacterium]